jgi:hypothetical protein
MTLADSLGNHPYTNLHYNEPSERWSLLDLNFINSSGSYIADNDYPSTNEEYYLSPGNYELDVMAEYNSLGPIINQKDTVYIDDGNDLHMDYEIEGGIFNLSLMEGTSYAYRSSCHLIPDVYWNVANLRLFRDMDSLLYVGAARCQEKFYFSPGVYRLQSEFARNFGDIPQKYNSSIVINKGETCDAILYVTNGTMESICSVSSEDLFADFRIEDKYVLFTKINTSHVNISIFPYNDGYLDNNMTIRFMHLDKNKNLVKQKDVSHFISGNSNSEISIVWEMDERDYLNVHLDIFNNISETDESNNNVVKRYVSLKPVFVMGDVRPRKANDEIVAYLKDNIVLGYIVEDREKAEVEVLVGRHNPLIMWHIPIKFMHDCGWTAASVYCKDKESSLPYASALQSFDHESKHFVHIIGNDIEGYVAGAKHFIEEQDLYLLDETSKLYGEDDEMAIQIFDYLSKYGNRSDPIHWSADQKNTKEYAEKIRNALYDRMFNSTQINVTTGSVILRMYHIEPSHSAIYMQYKDEEQIPVILARGLWSNLYDWKDFGEELANDYARDTWLIEITGGPGQDCDTCPNYDFQDLISDYYPTLIDGVLDSTGKDEFQYVGFSNGCRVALSSLEQGYVDPSKVETFIGGGCPGAFEGVSPGATFIDLFNVDQSISNLQSKDIYHVSLVKAILAGFFEPNEFEASDDKYISLNLLGNYSYWIESDSDIQPGIDLSLTNFAIIQGTFLKTSDGVVTTKDQEEIYNNIIIRDPEPGETNSKKLFGIVGTHTPLLLTKSMADTDRMKSIMEKTLQKEPLTWWQTKFQLKANETKS